MKFLALLLMMSVNLGAMAQLSDDFSDGDFTSNPAWSGSASDFDINSGMLHSQGPQANSEIYLSTPNTLFDSTEWSFLLRLDFNPSSTNQVRIYLCSDQSDLSGNLNGYFIQFGETGSAPDSLDIFKQSSSTKTKIFTGVNGLMTSSSSNMVRIKVVRWSSGQWSVFSDASGGTNFTPEGNFTDNTFNVTAYFGVVCDYSTASRYNLYYFDDFNISKLTPDLTAPTFSSLKIVSAADLDLKFSEPLDSYSVATLANYSINNGIGNPASAHRDSADFSVVHLHLPIPLQNAVNYSLNISGLKDLSGNTMPPVNSPFTFYRAVAYDVLINEIMADPDPPVGLPAVEYVELFNRSSFPISLAGWQFSDGTTTSILPDITIQADSFLLICEATSTDSFSSAIAKVGLSSFPSLNNTGETLTLKDDSGVLIHSVTYSDDRYGNAAKADGGWSLELINPNNPCLGDSNWSASNSPSGGTPGRENSIWDTVYSPAFSLLNVQVLNDTQIRLSFSAHFDAASSNNILNYSLSPGNIQPVSAQNDSTNLTKVILTFALPFDPGTLNTINAQVQNCEGEHISASNSKTFMLPDSVSEGDIVINEILFNPKSNGVDFVELYNRSAKVIDLSQLNILEKDVMAPSQILEQSAASPSNYLLFPHEYTVLTNDSENIKLNYYVENPSAIIETALPNFPDDAGICVLKTQKGLLVDSLAYDHNWHFALLTDEDGVSLERIDYAKPTQDPANWHSAASTVGYATPTYRNSQYSETGISDDAVRVEPEVFTPDNDGYKDYVFINYLFSEPGYTANVIIYDALGRAIRDLVHNELLGSKGSFRWDGIDDENHKARMGIYIAYVEVFNLKGKVKRWKKQLVLGGKL